MADEGISIDDKELQDFLSNIAGNLDNVAEHIIDDLAEMALDKMQEYYNASEYEQGSYMDFNKTGSHNDITVSMSGPQAWYSEFGTGSKGEQKPHPLKSEFPLNAYNSGPTIRRATKDVSEKALKNDDVRIPNGALYWTYKGEDGKIHYTQGIPAQQEVYKAGKQTIYKIPSVVKENLGGMFK